MAKTLGSKTRPRPPDSTWYATRAKNRHRKVRSFTLGEHEKQLLLRLHDDYMITYSRLVCMALRVLAAIADEDEEKIYKLLEEVCPPEKIGRGARREGYDYSV